jgi:hypothetical protein
MSELKGRSTVLPANGAFCRMGRLIHICALASTRPVALSEFAGSGIMYLVAFAGAWYLARLRVRRPDSTRTKREVDDGSPSGTFFPPNTEGAHSAALHESPPTDTLAA